MKKLGLAVLAGSLVVSNIPMNTPYVSAKMANLVLASAETDAQMKEDMAKMKESYIKFICGTKETNDNELVTPKVEAVTETARVAMISLIPEGERTDAMFTTNPELEGVEVTKVILDGTASANYTTTAKHIKALAQAYATYGSTYYQDEATKELVIKLLQEFYTNFYCNETYMTEYFGNWWDWEIGIPNALSPVFVIMENEIKAADAELLANYVVCMDKYLQKGKDGDVDLTSRFHTGANLADITMNRILQGIVTEDGMRISDAVANMMTVFAMVDPNNIVNGNTDGVYEDGSFIQHHRVAYTGSYGKTLLQKASQAVIVLSGTQFQPAEQLTTMQEWIYDCFSPIMYEGYVMEIVKGRAVSRTGTGYSDCNGIIDCMLQILPFLNEEEGAKLKEHIKYTASSMPVQPAATALSLSVISTYDAIMNDDSIQAVSHSNTGHYAFNSMDRNVHIRDDYAFALARSSNRISKYEYMSGENKKSWFQGDGVFYLYQSEHDQTQSYGHEFYSVAGAYNLPGTTVPVEERKTIQEWTNGLDYYENIELGFESGSTSQNDYVYFPVGTNTYSGSVELNGYGAAGLQLGDDNAYAAKEKGELPEDFVTYKNAEANKAYFMFDDEVVVMTSNIHDKLEREVVSTIDNRMSNAESTTTVEVGYTDGTQKALGENGTYKDVSWISYATNEAGSNVGYYFLETKDINIENGAKTGNINDIRKQNADLEVTHNLFTMTYNHGANPNKDSYCYVILPNADAAKTKEYAQNSKVVVLENSENVQAVEHTGLNMKGYMFYNAAQLNGVSAKSAASVLSQQNGEEVTYAISDPTFEQTAIELELDGAMQVVSKHDNISVDVKDGKTVLTVNVEKQNGKSFEVTLTSGQGATEDTQTEDNKAEETPVETKEGMGAGPIIGGLAVLALIGGYFGFKKKK